MKGLRDLAAVPERGPAVAAADLARRIARSVAVPGDSTAMKAVSVSAVIVACAVASISALSAGTGSKLGLVLPIAVLVGTGLGALAVTRFRAFVLTMLVLRSSLDAAKLSGDSAAGAARALDPSSLVAVLFLLCATLWLGAQYRRQGRLPGSGLRRALVVLVTAGFLSTLGSSNVQASAMEMLRILSVVIMFVVLEQMMVNREAIMQFLTAAFLSTVFPLAFTAWGYVSGSPPSEVKGSLSRITGTFNASNEFGRYLMLMIIFGAALHPHLDRRLKIPLRVILALSAVFMLLTYTRTALVGALLGLVVVGLIQSPRLLRVILVVGACAFFLLPQLTARFTDLAEESPAGRGSRNTLTWRFTYWTRVLPLARSNPITGIGLGTTQYATEEGKQPHNDFLRAYVETGIIGFVSYCALLVTLLRTGYGATRAYPAGSFDRSVGVGLLGCAVAFVAVSFSANVLSNVATLWYLFAFAAAASALIRQRAMASDPLRRRTVLSMFRSHLPARLRPGKA